MKVVRATVLTNSFSSGMLLIYFWIISCTVAGAQEKVNEEDFFSDTTTVVEVGKSSSLPVKPASSEAGSFGISGQILSSNQVFHNTSASPYDRVVADSTLVGDLYFDARYATYYKFFASLETYELHHWDDDYASAASDGSGRVRSRLAEMFVDTPIRQSVYLRWGKQVLQWGRCRLWNPTDLINIDRQTFVQRTTSRDGVYGVKMHIPSGTQYNYYAFIDTGKEWDWDRTAVAFKFELLYDKTEMAFSIWDKDGYLPVYGYDFSTRLLGLDLVGEVSASRGFRRYHLVDNDGVLERGRAPDDWRTRACLDIGRDFDFNEQPNKINVTGELFYNGSGYDEDIFNDQKGYSYRTPVALSDGSMLNAGSKSMFFLANDLYETNNYGKYYLALFTSVNRFFSSSYTWSNNLLRNASDGSSVYSTGINYQNIHNWSVDFNIYFFTGPKNREYTMAQTRTSYQLAVSWKF